MTLVSSYAQRCFVTFELAISVLYYVLRLENLIDPTDEPCTQKFSNHRAVYFIVMPFLFFSHALLGLCHFRTHLTLNSRLDCLTLPHQKSPLHRETSPHPTTQAPAAATVSLRGALGRTFPTVGSWLGTPQSMVTRAPWRAPLPL